MMTDKIKELRKLVPIPISEALQLLKANNGDVEESASQFKASCIEQICDLTGCDQDTAYEYYEDQQFDFNRTVSSIKTDMYDREYRAIDGVTKESISNIYQWLYIVETEDFGLSLDYQLLDAALATMLLIPSLTDVSEVIKKGKEAKDIIFEGYKDADSLDEFTRRHRVLDDSLEFQKANKTMSLKMTILKEELSKHRRNL